jgi:hypothetical protein
LQSTFCSVERTQYENSSLVNSVRDQLAARDLGANSLPAHLATFASIPIDWHRGHQRVRIAARYFVATVALTQRRSVKPRFVVPIDAFLAEADT